MTAEYQPRQLKTDKLDRTLFKLEQEYEKDHIQTFKYILDAWGYFKRTLSDNEELGVMKVIYQPAGCERQVVPFMPAVQTVFQYLANYCYEDLVKMGKKESADKIVKEAKEKYNLI